MTLIHCTALHCTANLLKELGNLALQIPDIEPNKEGLGNWYANLLRIDRRKCILFTNEKTLYSPHPQGQKGEPEEYRGRVPFKSEHEPAN